jgi:hypothetical protein
MRPSNERTAQPAGDVDSYQWFAERLDHWVDAINRGKWLSFDGSGELLTRPLSFKIG